jgi:hypothetical protein
MVDEQGNMKLADFGGTKDQASIDKGGQQTGLFSWGWADESARKGIYSKKSEVYSFACLCHYVLFADPLFNKENEKAYEDNTTKF